MSSASTSSSNPLRRLIDLLRWDDPGYVRLKQATKSVVAVGVALLLYRHAQQQERLFAAIAVAFIMQCVSAGSSRRQQVTMIVSAAGMMIATGLGAGFSFSIWTQAAVLAVVAFACFYVRRFLPNGDLFPIYGFILCLIATELPGGWRWAAWEMLAVATGLPIAFALRFLVLPYDPRKAAVAAIDNLRVATARFLAALVRYLGGAQNDHDELADAQADVEAVVRFDQTLLDGLPVSVRGEAWVLEILRHQYEVLQSLTLLRQSVRRVREARDDPNEPAVGHLRTLLALLAGAFGDRDGGEDRPVDEEAVQMSKTLVRGDRFLGGALPHLFVALRSARQLAQARRALDRDRALLASGHEGVQS